MFKTRRCYEGINVFCDLSYGLWRSLEIWKRWPRFYSASDGKERYWYIKENFGGSEKEVFKHSLIPTSRSFFFHSDPDQQADIEDITWPRVDMNFIFECSTRYLTSERGERVRYRVEHEKIKFISTRGHVIFCLLYKHRINSCEKAAIYYVTITTVISSRVKIWSFRGKAHLVFHWCLY